MVIEQDSRGLEVQELGHDEVCDLVVDRRTEEDDPVLEQARVDVEGALPALLEAARELLQLSLTEPAEKRNLPKFIDQLRHGLILTPLLLGWLSGRNVRGPTPIAPKTLKRSLKPARLSRFRQLGQ